MLDQSGTFTIFLLIFFEKFAPMHYAAVAEHILVEFRQLGILMGSQVAACKISSCIAPTSN